MSKPFYRISIAGAAIAMLVFMSPDLHAARGFKKNGEPMVVTSHSMDADKLGNKVTFSGNVTLKKEGLTLTSDSMIIFYDVKTKGIREIDAYGNVVVKKDGRTAFSNKAAYYTRDEKIVLTGDARVLENENEVGGETITLFMRDERSVVEGGKILFYQDKQPKTSEGGNRK